jgi:hypothetical protein
VGVLPKSRNLHLDPQGVVPCPGSDHYVLPHVAPPYLRMASRVQSLSGKRLARFSTPQKKRLQFCVVCLLCQDLYTASRRGWRQTNSTERNTAPRCSSLYIRHSAMIGSHCQKVAMLRRYIDFCVFLVSFLHCRLYIFVVVETCRRRRSS